MEQNGWTYTSQTLLIRIANRSNAKIVDRRLDNKKGLNPEELHQQRKRNDKGIKNGVSLKDIR
jgi:hypothetical protein